MIIENFNYRISHCNKKEIVSVFIKLGDFTILDENGDTLHFRPQFGNEVILNLKNGEIINLDSEFTFFSNNSSKHSFSIQILSEKLMGFNFELEQAYEKALFYRSVVPVF